MPKPKVASIVWLSIAMLFIYSCQRSAIRMSNNSISIPQELWEMINVSSNIDLVNSLKQQNLPIKYHIYRLNQSELFKLLDKAPLRTEININESSDNIPFPNPLGIFTNYKMTTTSLMEKELAEKYPELKTYEGQSQSKQETIRLSRNSLGIDAMILSTSGTFYIDPINLMEKTYYIVYLKKDFVNNKKERFYEPAIK